MLPPRPPKPPPPRPQAATAAPRRIAGTPEGRTHSRRALHVAQAARPSCVPVHALHMTVSQAGPSWEYDAMATVLIIGASRGIGLETVKAALEAGHSVCALARSARRIPIDHAKLEKMADDALEMTWRLKELHRRKHAPRRISLRHLCRYRALSTPRSPSSCARRAG